MPLYILPNVFSDEQKPQLLLPEGLSSVLLSLTGLIAESERTGRRYLVKLLGKEPQARELPIYLFNEHSSQEDIKVLAEKIISGESLGLLSDAGMPGIADPGSDLVHYLRRRGEKKIVIYPGPSSILLALVSSGLPGQKFSFHGYLPKEKEERFKKIRELERNSLRDGGTEIFIEAPYRNDALLKDFLEVLHGQTELATVSNITLQDEQVVVQKVDTWRRMPTTLEKKPTIFLFSAKGVVL